MAHSMTASPGVFNWVLMKIDWRVKPHQHSEKKYVPKEIAKTYEELVRRVDYHIDITRHRSLIYHHLSRILMWVTPIASGTLTVFIGESKNAGRIMSYSFYLSCAVTILTAMNSTIHPFEIALSAEKYANEFWRFHTNLQLEVERLYKEEKGNQRVWHRKTTLLLQTMNRDLCALVEEFNKSPGLELKSTRRTRRLSTFNSSDAGDT